MPIWAVEMFFPVQEDGVIKGEKMEHKQKIKKEDTGTHFVVYSQKISEAVAETSGIKAGTRVFYFDFCNRAEACSFSITALPSDQHDAMKAAYDKKYNIKQHTHLFVKELAHDANSGLAEMLHPAELRAAQHRGKMPKNCNVHHIIPLSMGGTNESSNLCLMDETLHMYLHQKLLDKVRSALQEGETALLILPKFKRVYTNKDYNLFFSPEEIEIIKQEESERQKRLQHHEQKKQEASGKKKPKKKERFVPADILKRADEINAAYRRKMRAIGHSQELAARKRLPVDPSTYLDSDKYQRRQIKNERRQNTRWNRGQFGIDDLQRD